MQKIVKLLPGYFYHIYNRGNNRENIFFEERNYHYFLELWVKYIVPIAETFAYCLLRNHFHFLVRIKESIQTSEVLETSEVSLKISKHFSNMFNAYAKAINKRHDRTGSLFQTRFGRKQVTNEAYLINLIHYIHFNPQEHGFVEDFRDYPYSSYQAVLTTKSTKLARDKVLDLFDDRAALIDFHQKDKDFSVIRELVEDDDF